jgi:hypothetical protein
MKNVLKITLVFSAFYMLTSCTKKTDISLTPITPVVVELDADAQKFIDKAGIVDTTQKAAINNLAIQLKDSALWQKFAGIYPMVGGSASSASFNLKNSSGTDSAYRLTFYGAPVFSGTGVLFPTLNDYADTHIADTSLGGYNNASMSYYSRTQNDISGYDMGCTDGAIPYNELSISFVDGDDSEWFGFSEDDIVTPNTVGLFMFSSTSSDVKRFRNGQIIDSKGAPAKDDYTNLTILIGKSRVTKHAGQRECALATLGNGLTDAEAIKFYNIVQNFETRLSR